MEHLKLSSLTAFWLPPIENRSCKELSLYTLVTRGRWNYPRFFFLACLFCDYKLDPDIGSGVEPANYCVWKGGRTPPARSSSSEAALLPRGTRSLRDRTPHTAGSRHPRVPSGPGLKEGVRAGSHSGPRPSRPLSGSVRGVASASRQQRRPVPAAGLGGGGAMAELRAGLRCGRPLLLLTCLFAPVLGKPGAGPAARAPQAGKALGGEPGGTRGVPLGPGAAGRPG